MDRTEETLFKLASVVVRGETTVYEDGPLRSAVREATDGRLDQPWRFVFVTDLSFRPPLHSSVSTAAVFPLVVTSARRAFANDLRERGFRNVDRRRSENVRTASGTRARLTRYTATYDPVPSDAAASPQVDSGIEDEIELSGCLSVWADDGDFRLAGGVYPVSGLDAIVPDVASEPGEYRRELLDILRALG